MSEFPTAVPTFTDFDPAATLAASNHAARHNKVHEEVEAIAAKVGVDGSADANSLDKKVADLRTDLTAVESSTSTTVEMDAAIAAAIATAKSALYPVGSIYTNATNATNPNTLLGFGTWTAFATGRVLVGVDSGQAEFDGVGETGGAKTHTLTEAEMPSHTHGIGTLQRVGNPGHVDNAATNLDDLPGSNGPLTGSNQIIGGAWTGALANTGGGGAHNNLQPYITVYMWRRTA